MGRNPLSGQRFGRWVVLEKIGKNKWYEALYKCLCDCGAEGTVARRALLEGTSKQCADCGRKAAAATRTKPPNVVAVNVIYGYYSAHARERNYAWKISKEEFAQYIFKDCFYCSASPSQIMRTPAHTVLYNGIDRVDNSKGYIAGNLVTACGTCNRWKSDMGIEAFLQHIQRIAQKCCH